MAKKKPKWRSKFEKSVADQLTKLKIPYKYEAKKLKYTNRTVGKRYTCERCGTSEIKQHGTYLPDFMVGTKTFVESKGKWLARDRAKMVCVIEQYPEYKFYMVFMRDNKINKNSTTRYSDFCRKNGIEYSIGSVKKEWFK